MKKIRELVCEHPVTFLALFVFAVLSIGTLGMEITRINIRFAMMTQEMAHYPIGCFPTINGLPYADYPVLYNLFAYWTSLGARIINHFTLSLPTILFGCYTLVMTAKIGERIRSGLGIAAMLFSLLSFEYLDIFLQFSIDMPVAAAAVTIVYLLIRYDFSWRAVPGYMLVLAAAFAIRGPLGVILSGAVTAGYILGARRWKALFVFGAAGAVAAALCLGLAWWAIRLQGGDELLQAVAEWQVSSRIKGGKVLYYFTNAMGSFALTTFIALLCAIMKRRELVAYPLASLVLWALVPMIVLSIPGCKHLRYLTPAIPGFALTAAYGFTASDGSIWAKILERGIAIIDRIFYPVMALAMCGGGVYMLFTPHAIFAAYCFGALILLSAIYFSLRRESGKLAPVLRIALMGVTCVALGFPPIEAVTENSSRFVETVEKQRRGELYFFKLGPDHDDLKYLFHMPYDRRKAVYLIPRHNVRRKPPEQAADLLMYRMYPHQAVEEVFAQLGPDDIVITIQKHYDELVKFAAAQRKQVRIVARGRLGHRDAVAVTLTAGDAPGR